MDGSAEELRVRAAALYRRDAFQEALAVASQALEEAERALGPEHVDLLLWLNVLLRCQFATGAREAALTTFERCEKIASGQPETPLSFVGALLALADFCDEAREWHSALSLYARVFKMCEHPPVRHLQTAADVASVNAAMAQALKGMGMASFRMGDPGRAEECLEKSLLFFEAAYGGDAQETREARANLLAIRAKGAERPEIRSERRGRPGSAAPRAATRARARSRRGRR